MSEDVMCDCGEPHLTPEDRQALIALLDRGTEELRVMRAHGWPLAAPRELIPPAFRRRSIGTAGDSAVQHLA